MKVGWLRRAAHLWNRGLGTTEIAAVVGLSESAIYNSLDTIKRVSSEMKTEWPADTQQGYHYRRHKT